MTWTRPEGPPPVVLVDTIAAAHAIGVKPAAIRDWARRGHLERKGKDKQGRTQYVLADVCRVHKEKTIRLKNIDTQS